MLSATKTDAGARPGEQGHALLLCLLVMAVLTAITISQFSMVQKNLQQSTFFHDRSFLRDCAETGVALSIHDLNFRISVAEGLVGTESWTTANDFGRDGLPGTGDTGEGDSTPTIGEPNVFPQPVGPAYQSIGVIAHVHDTALPEVKRIVAEASNGRDVVLVEAQVRRTIVELPKAGSVYVDPDATLTLAGNSFRIDGNDTNLDGSDGSDPALAGIATTEGSTPGDNSAELLSQIDSNRFDQVDGSGGTPSVGEAGSIDMESYYEYFKSVSTNPVPPGAYSQADQIDMGNGSTGDYKVTYVDGDLDLSGQHVGAGVLVVEGDLTMSGQSRFDGIVIVRGDVDLSGGGAGIHIYGALITLGSEFSVSGNADILFSSEAMANVLQNLPLDYAVVFYREL